MSRNGSGTYTLPAGNPVVTGTTIASTWANNTMNDLASAMTDSVAADGQTAMTGNLNLNSNKIVNLATPTLSTDAVTKAYVDTADALSLLKASNLSDVANATTSRTNLVAAKSGANSDITSLTGLTTPLTVAQGGIGAATLTANNVLLGNGTSALQVVAPSTSGNVLTSNGTTWTSVAGAYPLTSGTAVASTSGTSIDFTSIPSWVKRITVMFDGVSGSGTSSLLVQLGTGSTTFTTSGYVATGSFTDTGTNLVTSTAGFPIFTNSASFAFSGLMVITNVTGNTWVSNHAGANSTSYSNNGGGNVALGATLTAVRITRVNGTDTFVAGSINILYE